MHKLKSICVFCGSSPGNDPEFITEAESVGKYFAENGIRLVYGGGRLGLMGAVADAVMHNGGEVIGIIPQNLDRREVANRDITELRVVNTMHERKALMAELSDGFIALPGGFGTFEEFCEVITWTQLGIHNKPCGLLNVKGYYDGLIEVFDTAVASGFVSAEHREIVLSGKDIGMLIESMSDFDLVAKDKWMSKDES